MGQAGRSRSITIIYSGMKHESEIHCLASLHGTSMPDISKNTSDIGALHIE
jgi:hypothetical protein